MPLSGLLKSRKIHDGCSVGYRQKRGLMLRFGVLLLWWKLLCSKPECDGRQTCMMLSEDTHGF